MPSRRCAAYVGPITYSRLQAYPMPHFLLTPPRLSCCSAPPPPRAQPPTMGGEPLGCDPLDFHVAFPSVVGPGPRPRPPRRAGASRPCGCLSRFSFFRVRCTWQFSPHPPGPFALHPPPVLLRPCASFGPAEVPLQPPQPPRALPPGR